MNLKNKTDSINSRDDFVAFVEALQHDLVTNPGDWENSTLDAFLEAVSAWVRDMDGYYENNHVPVPESPNWKFMAEMMLAAKFYE